LDCGRSPVADEEALVRFVIMVEVKGERASTWHRRVIHCPVGVEWSTLLRYPSVALSVLQKVPDPGGGLLVLCDPLDGEHFAWRLRDSVFEPCDPPDAQ
jgi:hypothetical protein